MDSWATHILKLLDQLCNHYWLQDGYTQSTLEEQFATMTSLVGPADVNYKYRTTFSCSYFAVIEK
jgi:hypothetical protein